MITLYEYSPTRSNRAKWALEEVGAPYESRAVDLMAGEQDGEAYRTVQPLGVVPALRTDTYTMYESAAIVMQVIDEHPDAGLAPPPGSPDRALYYQWCVFAAAEVDRAVMMVFDNTLRPPEGMRPPGTAHNPETAAQGRWAFQNLAEIISAALTDKDYLVGGSFGGADIMIGHSCFMAYHVKLMAPGDYPVLDAYYARLAGRPAHRRIYPQD